MGAAVVIYAFLVVALTWPMALHLQAAILGGGDAYHHLWGFWWFDRALEHASAFWDCPLVFHPYGANLVVDDWPLAPNLLGFLTRRLGLTLIGSYNASLLLAMWLNAVSVFVLVRAVVKEWLPAFAAGIFFAFSPYFWGRLHGHLGLVHAYPLALFAFCLYKSHQSRSALWALGIGGALGLAVWSQYYYAIFAGGYLVLAYLYEACPVSLRVEQRETARPRVAWMLVVVGSLAAVVAVAVALVYGQDSPFARVQGSAGRLARPMAIWWMSWLLALVCCYRVVLIRRDKAPAPPWDNGFRFWGCAALPVILLLLPVLVGVAQLATSGDLPALKLNLKPEWSGAFALAALFPNVYHFLWGPTLQQALHTWGLLERATIGLGWTAIAISWLTGAYRRAGWWTVAFCAFLLLSLGPFLEISPGLDHGPILPFWLVRFLPILSEARVPSRWIVAALVAGSVLVGLAFQRIRSAGWRAVALGAMLFEGLALPLSVVTPEVPVPYQIAARDGRAGAILELPFGACDGRGCWGAGFPAIRLYYQTVHERPVVGGYLSRISKTVLGRYRDEPILRQLVALQNEPPPPSPVARRRVEIDRESFTRWMADWGIAWVVLDRTSASAALGGAVLRALGTPLVEHGGLAAWKTSRSPDADRAAGT